MHWILVWPLGVDTYQVISWLENTTHILTEFTTYSLIFTLGTPRWRFPCGKLKVHHAVQDLEEGAVCTVYLAMKPTTERSSTTAPAPVAPVVSRGPTAASQPAVSEALAPSRQATTMTPPAPTMEGNAGRREEASSTAGVSSHEPVRPAVLRVAPASSAYMAYMASSALHSMPGHHAES